LPKNGFKTKKFSDVPLILLDSGSEFSIFAVNDPYFAEAKKKGILISDANAAAQLQWTIKYGSLFYRYANLEDAVSAIKDVYKSPIYAITITWGTDASIVGTEFAKLWGAHHGIFLPLLTQKPILTSALFPKAFQNSGAKDLSDKLQKYLKNFIWNGNPNGEGLTKWESWGKTPNILFADADIKNADFKLSPQTIDYNQVLNDLYKDDSIEAQNKAQIIKQVLNGRWFSKGIDKKFKNGGIWVIK
jgi:para-nitrobenzyl esterase